VEGLPEDPEARREWLERWAAERELELDQREPSATLKVRRALSPVWEALGHLELRMTQYAGRMLDRGLETEGNVKGLEHQHPDRVLYHPSAWHVLPLALRYIGVSDRDTFVDFGCGKGRIVHQAAMRPFRRVIGVEIAPDLAEIARAALAARSSRHRCHDVEIVVADATEFAVPDDLTIAYLFDPFGGKTLDAVLGNIIDSLDRRPRRIRLIYVHPTAAHQILATKRFRLLKVQRGGLRDWPISRAEIYESC
jgi:SAM-dependent methyltransferase